MPDRNGNRQSNSRASLMALLVIVILFVIGWVLVHELYSSGRLEDCLLSGRTNCAPLQQPTQ